MAIDNTDNPLTPDRIDTLDSAADNFARLNLPSYSEESYCELQSFIYSRANCAVNKDDLDFLVTLLRNPYMSYEEILGQGGSSVSAEVRTKNVVIRATAILGDSEWKRQTFNEFQAKFRAGSES